ncbi:DUF1648 domain-containing protein [Brevundimonas sp. WCHBH090558]|uniref:SdpI family protein n=1 Tax=Brevundimonas huaxiensis TaxID=2725493 RepID=UPI0016249917|nr:SdpI family protein [Brevundimonas huaxiensis]MBC1181906.1 DUF1648 domain-containing protein [Brevundimonas huaxiensis]
MTRRLNLADAVTALSVVLLAALATAVAIKGPAGPVPMHFDLQGRPDRWGDRLELAILLAGLAGLAALLGWGMGWAAARSEDPARTRGLRLGQWITAPLVAAVGAFLTWIMLRGADGAGPLEPELGWVMAGTGLLFAVIGSVLGRVPPNIVAGVRTPWAFKSRLAWDRSKRLAGRLMFWIGLASLLAAPVSPQPAGLFVQMAAVLIAAFWSVVESWRVWRADPDRQPF